MKVAVLSDIHANYAALLAVLSHVKAQHVDGVWVLGDIIGRGCNPIEVAAEMKLLYDEQKEIHRAAWLSGNHERFVLSNSNLEGIDIPPVGFIDAMSSYTVSGDNHYAIDVAHEHAKILSKRVDLLRWLHELPTYRNLYPEKGIHLVHAAMRFDTSSGAMYESETYNTYLWDANPIGAQFTEAKQFAGGLVRLMLGGHTHSSCLWSWQDGALHEHKLVTSHSFNLENTMVYANPGSVGFPRAADSCPTYMILNFDDSLTRVHITRHTVKYQPDIRDCWTTYPDVYLNEMKKCNL